MDRLASLIPSVLRKRGLYDDAQAALVIYRAKKWMEEKHADSASAIHPLTLSGGILTISVDDPIAEKKATELMPDLLLFLQSDSSTVIKEMRVQRK